MDHTLKQALIGIVGRANFTDSLIDLISYSYDASDHDHRPDAALWPTCSEEVPRIFQLADRYRFPHFGSATQDTREQMAVVAARNAITMLRGKNRRILSILKCSNLPNIGEGRVEGGKYKVECRMWFEEIFNSP